MAQGYELPGPRNVPTLGLGVECLTLTWHSVSSFLPRLAWGLFLILTGLSEDTHVKRTGTPRVNTAPRRRKFRVPWGLISSEAG